MNVGGPAWQSSVLTRGLAGHGYETRLLAGRVDKGEADFVALRDPDLPVVDIEGLGRSVRIGGDLRAFVSICREIRRFRPHIVHTHTAKAGVLGRLAAFVNRVPVRVHTFHGHVLHGYFSPPVSRLVRLVERVLARGTTALVAVGERVRDELVEAGIGQRDRFTAIAPGVEEPPAIDREIARQLLGLPLEVPVVMFVGRLTAIKRPDRLVEAFGMVLERIPEAVLAVAGEGELLEEVRRSVERLGDSVRLLGWQSDVGRLYAAADLVVISSDNEGMPMTLIEAAMAGVPGVTTDVGSASEVVVHGSTGLVVAPDARDLADAIIVLLVDDDRRSDMGRAAAEQAIVRFGAARLVADHVALYRRIIAC
ncbi:MAG TPA: glycosyltransferase family 1 protein [Acidimicrobiaceae bacterium]|nr:glycosyltransferase family 1 protein [Acidimicrobiaceae bacterium]